MDRRAELVAAVGAVRLGLGAVLQVADELVVLRHLVGELAGVVAQLGVERRAVEERAGRRRRHRVALVEERAERPDAIAEDREADADVGVLVAGQAVAVGPDAGAGRRGDLLQGEVVALDALVLHVVVDAEARRVAAALAHELGQDARVRHLGRVGRRADEHLFEGAVVEIEASGGGAFSGVDALDQRAVLARIAVGEVGGLGAHGGAAHVDAVERDRRRRRQQRPHVAGVGEGVHPILVEVGLQAGGRGVDDRRLAADRDRLLQRGDAQRHVDLGVEAQGDADAVAGDGTEAGQLVVERVGAGRHGGEAVDPRFVGNRRQRAGLGRAGGGDGDAGQHTALFVFHFARDTAGRTRTPALRERARGGQQRDGCEREQCPAPTCHGNNLLWGCRANAPAPGAEAAKEGGPIDRIRRQGESPASAMPIPGSDADRPTICDQLRCGRDERSNRGTNVVEDAKFASFANLRRPGFNGPNDGIRPCGFGTRHRGRKLQFFGWSGFKNPDDRLTASGAEAR